jgi:hypothetical protein
VIIRRDTLEQALDQLEAGALAGAATLVVSRAWWDSLSPNEQDRYRVRAARAGVDLRADATMSSHFVEVCGEDIGPPLSSEHPI